MPQHFLTFLSYFVSAHRLESPVIVYLDGPWQQRCWSNRGCLHMFTFLNQCYSSTSCHLTNESSSKTLWSFDDKTLWRCMNEKLRVAHIVKRLKACQLDLIYCILQWKAGCLSGVLQGRILTWWLSFWECKYSLKIAYNLCNWLGTWTAYWPMLPGNALN
jgi:hypothetical protein